ncbi:MAG: hypothetical protein ACFE9I_00060 [Candidatus Hermodarchaeota archaeon]
MTGQVQDEFIYNGEKYDVLGVKGREMYTLKEFGLIPSSFTTACYRGFIMRYKITSNHLFLDRLYITAENPPMINNIKPTIISKENKESWIEDMFKYKYLNLQLKVPFSGEFLLGKDFDRSKDTHMGYPPIKAYRTRLKIKFKNSEIVKIEIKS